VLAADGLADEDLAALQEKLKAVDILAGLERAMRGERARLLEMVNATLSEQQDKRGFEFWLYRHTLVANDIRFALRQVHRQSECVTRLRDGRPWPEVSEALLSSSAEIDKKRGSFQRYFYLASLTSDMSDCNFTLIHSGVRRETELRLAVAATAIKRFRIKRGAWPSSLEELVPTYLDKIPLDCMDIRPLRYVAATNDTFLLYSIGEDGIDHQGDSSLIERGMIPGIWTGRDAVWPTAE
jgi:hypothetical protein